MPLKMEMETEKAEDISFIEKKSSRRVLPKDKDEQIKIERAKKLTHLYMHGNSISNIGNISVCENLTVLYLHDNEITKIENLDSAVNLKCLYLQRNKIEKIENMDKLVNLQKLYLGHNYISVLEGLENQVNLLELHIEKQALGKGDGFCFDPRSIRALSNNLQVLNISHNQITSLNNLQPLFFLEQLNASNNLLNDVDDICDTLSKLYHLVEATFSGNPVCKIHRYRESIIGHTERLSTLDGKTITDTNRSFIKRFEYEKLHHRLSKPSINLCDMYKSLPKNYPPVIQKAINASLVGKTRDKLNIGDDVEVCDVYVPWKALPKKVSPRLKNKNKNQKCTSNKRKTLKSAVTNIKFNSQ